MRNRLRRQLRVVCSELEVTGELEPAAYLVVVRPDAAGAEMSTLLAAVRGANQRMPSIAHGDAQTTNGHFE